MRRFVQALTGANIDQAVPEGVRAALVTLPQRYNVSLRGFAGILFIRDGRWKLGEMSWGLVPSWEKEPSTRYSTQAARLERARTSRLYRSAWTGRRCLLPLNGYYKWDRAVKPPQPYFIQAANGAVLFAAALWSLWGGEEDGLLSFSVLTHPNEAIPEPLVPDGPRFVPPDKLADWVLADPGKAKRWLLAQPQPALEAYAVSRRVADRKLDEYSLLEPLAATEAFDAAFALDGGDADYDEDIDEDA